MPCFPTSLSFLANERHVLFHVYSPLSLLLYPSHHPMQRTTLFSTPSLPSSLPLSPSYATYHPILHSLPPFFSTPLTILCNVPPYSPLPPSLLSLPLSPSYATYHPILHSLPPFFLYPSHHPMQRTTLFSTPSLPSFSTPLTILCNVPPYSPLPPSLLSLPLSPSYATYHPILHSLPPFFLYPSHHPMQRTTLFSTPSLPSFSTPLTILCNVPPYSPLPPSLLSLPLSPSYATYHPILHSLPPFFLYPSHHPMQRTTLFSTPSLPSFSTPLTILCNVPPYSPLPPSLLLPLSPSYATYHPILHSLSPFFYPSHHPMQRTTLFSTPSLPSFSTPLTILCNVPPYSPPLLSPPLPSSLRALHLAIIHNHQDVVLQLLDVLPQLPPTETPVVDCLNNHRQVFVGLV